MVLEQVTKEREQGAERAVPSRSAPEMPRRIGSAELFAGATEIEIDHEGAVYRLRMTRQGKLILNK